MRVLCVVADFPALSETFVLDQITGLIDRGFTVSILAARARDEAESHPDIAAYRLLDRVRYADWTKRQGLGLLGWIGIMFDLARQGRLQLLKEIVAAGLRRRLKRPFVVGALQLLVYAEAVEDLPPPDVVLCHFGPNGDLMVRVRKALGARWPVATFFHGYDISNLLAKMGPRIYDRLLRDGDLFLPASGFFRMRLAELGAAADRMSVQRMGVRPESEWRGEQPTPGGKKCEFVFISVGRLVEKKGHEYTVRALARCRQRHPDIDMKLRIVGGGPLMDKLQDMIADLGLEGSVQLSCSLPREDIKGRLLSADAFVLPSVTAENGDMEGFPVAILEAMAAGLPVLTTRHGGIPEIVDDGVTGLLAAERDVDGLADAMHRIARDRSLADRLGRAAREKVERDLDLDRWNDKLADRIRRLAAAGSLLEPQRKLQPEQVVP